MLFLLLLLEKRGVAMSDEESDAKAKEVRVQDLVPYFKNHKNQIVFEFFYLVALLLGASYFLFWIQFNPHFMEYKNKVFVFAILGGFFGGWVYDAKWFYRVTARGRSDQCNYLWQPHKFYWRVLTPFLSCIVAFVTYLLIASGMFQLELKNATAASTAFSMCFILGYFSDLVLSRLAAWAEKVLPKGKNDTDVNGESDAGM